MSPVARAAAPLEADAVEALTGELMAAIKGHYLRRPLARSTAQEVLNALAICAATVLGAARAIGDEASAREFFDLALESQLDDLEGAGG